MTEVVFNVDEYMDEIIPEGNGPSLEDCAQFLLSGSKPNSSYPDEERWPPVGEQLKNDGDIVSISRREINWTKVQAGDNGELFAATPEAEMVAISYGNRLGWSPDAIFEDFSELLSESGDEIRVGDWIAYETSKSSDYVFIIDNGKPTLSLVQ